MCRTLSLLFLCCGFLFGARDKVTERIDARRIVLLDRIPARATAAVDQGPADGSLLIQYATLMLKTDDSLESFLAAQQDPASPLFRKWLTPEQFGDRFGLTANDLAKLTDWLLSQGLIVHDIARGRHWITFSGATAQVNNAFHTEIHRYLAKGRMHFANATPLSVPAAFEQVVTGLTGLDDFHPKPTPLLAKAKPDFDNYNGVHYLAPDDIATIFDISPLYAAGIDGSGQKIAVIGSSDVNLNDIELFRAKFGLSANYPQPVLYGPDPGTSSEGMIEADIDLEWAGAVARNATIFYVYSQNIFVSVQYAVDRNLASVMTSSYGSCEQENSPLLRTVAQQANAQGITWMSASGDGGAAICDQYGPVPQATKGLSVKYPASMPEVTAVGGPARWAR